MASRYRDRTEAGEVLASHLLHYAGRNDVLVLALPRGGVPVGHQIAKTLQAPLDVFLVRKLGVPGQEELAMGAIASGGVCVLNHDVIESMEIPQHVIDEVASAERQELERRQRAYRGDRPLPEVRQRTVILVDDGLATGATMRAAAAALHKLGPRRIVVAAPVAPASTCDELRQEVDEVVCPLTPESFYAIGAWYTDFAQTSDQEVCRLLQDAAVP